MKLRSLAFILVATSVTAANAADVRFFLGYADPAFAALNGKNVGDELKAVNTVAVGVNFNVSIFVVNTTSSDKSYSGGGAFLGYDTASTNNSTTGYGTFNTGKAAADTAGLKKKLRLLSGASAAALYQSPGTGYDGTTSGAGLTDVSFLTGVYRGRFAGSTASVRSIGLSSNLGFGTGNQIVLHSNAPVRLGNMAVQNLIGANDTYGDATDENGLTLNSFPASTSGGNFLGTTAAGNPGQDVKYAFQTVPEPGTVLAIGAGLAALVARRRRNG